MSAVATDTQRRAARVVGLAYLLALAPAIFAEFYVRGRLVIPDNAAETARQIVLHERLFRLGIASDLIVCAIDVVLVTALYVVLERVSRPLALAAALFRLLETAILIVATMADLEALRILGGAGYLRAFDAAGLDAMARLSIGAHADVYNVALLLFGCGSPIFCYLWYRSRYIPRVLAAWGIVASVFIGVCAFTFVIFPDVGQVLTAGYYGGPIFIFELAAGAWLLVRGIPGG